MRNSIIVYNSALLFLDIQDPGTSEKFKDNDSVVWHKKANGVWIYSAGHPDRMNLLCNPGAAPKYKEINNMSTGNLPIKQDEINLKEPEKY